MAGGDFPHGPFPRWMMSWAVVLSRPGLPGTTTQMPPLPSAADASSGTTAAYLRLSSRAQDFATQKAAIQRAAISPGWTEKTGPLGRPHLGVPD